MGKKKKKDSVADKKAAANKVPNINNLDEADTYSIDFDKLVKNEYQRLLRQYRLMEDERHAVAAKGKALSKQARLLDLLYEEVRDIKTDLYNVDCARNRAADGVTRRTILDMLEGYDKANEEQEFCLKNIRELSVHVDRIIKYLVDHKLKVQAIYGNSRTHAQVEKRRRILENRLYFYTTRYCLKIHDNKVIRKDEINLSLKLRGLFHTRHTSLKRQMQEIRIRMGEVVFLATQAYDQRDELVTSIRNIRERNDKDNRQHVLEMKEFNRIIHHDALIRGFLQKKLCARNIDETEKQRSSRKNQNKLNMLNRQLALYARSFNTILTKSSFSSMEGLIRSYNEKMQQNFATFRSNCDLNHEIVAMRADNLALSHAIELQYEEANERVRQNELEVVEAEKVKEGCQAQLNGLKSMVANSETNMDEVVKVIDSLYNLIGCSKQSLTVFLGNQDGIKPRNAVFCMQLIESRVQELVHHKNQLETRKNFELLNQGLKEQRTVVADAGPKGKSAGGPFLPNVVVSSHVEDNEDEEDDRLTVRPIHEEELRRLITERLRNKKDGGGFGFGGGSAGARQSTVSRSSTMGHGSMSDVHDHDQDASAYARKTVDATSGSASVARLSEQDRVARLSEQDRTNP